jgi:hypothetical protein
MIDAANKARVRLQFVTPYGVRFPPCNFLLAAIPSEGIADALASEQTLVACACCEKDRADIDASGLRDRPLGV